MKERLANFIKNEKLKAFSAKVFTKKKIVTVIAIIALLAVLRIGFTLAFEIKGTVLKVGTNSIVVTNFLGTKTVNTGSYLIDTNSIIVGEKIEMHKNLSGDVISIRVDGGRYGQDKFGPGGQFGRGGRFGQRKNVQGGFNRMPDQDTTDGSTGASEKN